MITEMAKIESRRALADLIEVITEEGLNNIIDLLKAVKQDFRSPNNKRTLIQCIAEASSTMMWRQHECEHAKTMKSMNEKLDRLESGFNEKRAFKKDVSLRSIPSEIPEKIKPKNSTLKVIIGGLTFFFNVLIISKCMTIFAVKCNR